ncbi:MAG: hypothetical protein OXU61_02175 [Gammaproteobacteria bacterium]|nr:hypothetical protein [Gammaproteobacteria bacterium]
MQQPPNRTYSKRRLPFPDAAASSPDIASLRGAPPMCRLRPAPRRAGGG